MEVIEKVGKDPTTLTSSRDALNAAVSGPLADFITKFQLPATAPEIPKALQGVNLLDLTKGLIETTTVFLTNPFIAGVDVWEKVNVLTSAVKILTRMRNSQIIQVLTQSRSIAVSMRAIELALKELEALTLPTTERKDQPETNDRDRSTETNHKQTLVSCATNGINWFHNVVVIATNHVRATLLNDTFTPLHINLVRFNRPHPLSILHYLPGFLGYDQNLTSSPPPSTPPSSSPIKPGLASLTRLLSSPALLRHPSLRNDALTTLTRAIMMLCTDQAFSRAGVDAGLPNCYMFNLLVLSSPIQSISSSNNTSSPLLTPSSSSSSTSSSSFSTSITSTTTTTTTTQSSPSSSTLSTSTSSPSQAATPLYSTALDITTFISSPSPTHLNPRSHPSSLRRAICETLRAMYMSLAFASPEALQTKSHPQLVWDTYLCAMDVLSIGVDNSLLQSNTSSSSTTTTDSTSPPYNTPTDNQLTSSTATPPSTVESSSSSGDTHPITQMLSHLPAFKPFPNWQPRDPLTCINHPLDPSHLSSLSLPTDSILDLGIPPSSPLPPTQPDLPSLASVKDEIIKCLAAIPQQLADPMAQNTRGLSYLLTHLAYQLGRLPPITFRIHTPGQSSSSSSTTTTTSSSSSTTPSSSPPVSMHTDILPTVLAIMSLSRSSDQARRYFKLALFGEFANRPSSLGPSGSKEEVVKAATTKGGAGANMDPVWAIHPSDLDGQGNTTLKARLVCMLMYPSPDDADEYVRLVGFGRGVGYLSSQGILNLR